VARFSWVVVFMNSIPLFRTENAVLIIYIALNVMLNSMMIFRSTVKDPDSDEEEADTVEIVIPKQDPVKEVNKVVETAPEVAVQHKARPRLLTGNIPIPTQNREYRMPVRTYATNPINVETQPVMETTHKHQSNEEGKSLLLQLYSKKTINN
jgi:transcriptional regulator of NAD metabolism